MPIYEYVCEACGKRSSALLQSYASPDPSCPHCGNQALRRMVSTFATVRSEEGGEDLGGDDSDSDMDGGEMDGDGGWGDDDDF